MPKRSSADPAKVAAAVRVVLSGALSQRAAGKRYGVPKTTLRRAVEKAREGMEQEEQEEADGRTDDVDRAGPDRRTGSGPDRTTPNQMTRPGERWQEVASFLQGDARLDGPQVQAAAMLVAAHPHEAVAAACGTSSRTLSRWKNDPVFQSVLTDMRTACHVQALDVLARGAEAGIAAMAAGAELHREINTEALDLMRRFRDGEEGVDLEAVRRAVGLAVEASKMTAQSRGLMDAGGYPKTSRVEVHATAETGEDRSDDDLLAELEQMEPELRVLQGGRG